MKIKSGFTLAEVLITLAIIGVVATLTLPSLMTNSKEQQYIAAVKKGINTITEAVSLNVATDGFDFNDVEEKTVKVGNKDVKIGGFGSGTEIYDSNGNLSVTVAGILGSKGNIDSKKTTSDEIIFKDGSSIQKPASTTGLTCTTRTAEGVTATTLVMFDANGPQMPNKDFTCSADNIAGCSNKNSRVAGDRFYLCLGGTTVYPTDDTSAQGKALEWILSGARTATDKGNN